MKISNADFVHLHTHSEYSRFDGLNKIGDFVLQARKMGFKALALTDHGNVGGLIKFYTECKKKKDKKDKEIPYDPIKPILGCEVYLSKNRHARGKEQQPDGRKGNRHLLLLAKNKIGYENLCALVQCGYTEGQAFGDPRIDLEILAQHSSGLICSSACLSSVINNNLLVGRYDQAAKAAKVLKDIFGEDFYLEAMYHGIDAEGYIISDIIKLGRQLDVPIICSNDAHYCFKEQAESHEVLVAMSTSKCIKDPKRYKFPYGEFYLKSAEEMWKIFGTQPQFLYNTVALSEKVEDFIKPGIMRLPQFRMPTGSGIKQCHNQQEAYAKLKQLALEGMKRLGWDQSPAHVKQLNIELEDVQIAWTANKMDFATYFLIVWQYINFAKEKGILTGCGRGSGYASVLLRALGITYGPDPIKYGLLWERFLSFDQAHFINDSDWGIGDAETAAVSIDEVVALGDDEEDKEENSNAEEEDNY